MGDLGFCHPSSLLVQGRRGQKKQNPCRQHPSTLGNNDE